MTNSLTGNNLTNKNKAKNMLILFIDILIALYVTSIYVFSYSSSLNKYSKFLALALMGMIALYLITKRSIRICGLLISLGGFTLFCAMSVFWAKDASAATSKVFTMIQIFALVFLLYNYLSMENKFDFFLKIMCISGTIFAVYTVLYLGIDNYFSGLEEGLRLGGEINNVNAIGMMTAMTALFNFWYFIYRKKTVCLIFSIICIVVTLGSGSRTALAGLLGGIVILFVLKGNSVKKLVSIFECILVLGVLLLILQLPMFSGFMDRFEMMINGFTGSGDVDNSTSVRLGMIKAGFDVFKQHPFLGIGIGNSGVITEEHFGRSTYLHNNYVELLATTGIIGTAFYYIAVLAPMFYLAKSALKQDGKSILVIALTLVTLVFHIGSVYYYIKVASLYLVIVWLCVFGERKNESK